MEYNKKIKFYTRDISDLSFLSDNASYYNGNIDMSASNFWDASGKFIPGNKNETISNAIPNKQYKNDVNIENKLRQPCSNNNNNSSFKNHNKSNKYASIDTEIKSESTKILNENLTSETPIIDTNNNIINDLPKNISCSQRKHSLDWSNYRAPPVQITGRGFGIVDDWDKLYIGQDTRNDIKANNPRLIETTNLAMLPLDGFRINYSTNLDRYETDLRSGIDTRFANKKSMKN